MKWGIVELYCPICATRIVYNANVPNPTLHHREFGRVCSKDCWLQADLKHTRMIMGVDEPKLR